MSEGRVTGIGGLFFRSKDPKAPAAWYTAHLGIGRFARIRDPEGTSIELWEPDAG